MSEDFNLEAYLSAGVEKIIRGIRKASLLHPSEAVFMAKYALASKNATKKRKTAAAQGKHVPPFLIASITSICNLHCEGCYARSLDSCSDETPTEQMTGADWSRVFHQAKEMGVGFILLAGGEPMVRRDVLAEAAKVPEILFPVFTNGTMFSPEYLDLFDTYRNLVPILSIEGGRHTTDARRGEGIYEQLQAGMQKLRQRHIAFGASVTVTKQNLAEVTSEEYIRTLEQAGCKAIIYVEFVPTSEALSYLAPDDTTRRQLAEQLDELRRDEDSMLMISFPGDEKSSGGCLAAGRGFFHINSQGGAEPCPFSPYSDINVKDHTLWEVMQSQLFCELREHHLLEEEHDGGCVLYTRRKQVEALLAQD